ncbi:hypothetical protein GCM10011391_22580 [Pullulanibacillus camelliae]|uniref:Uncharacterized protein n=1 Tax=Pullulanibacillus camelliae TaxID=1707096 RepID=A0A8J3DW92_9BACL|nr:hypothetical protein [Pullulanibacillus camelliae]GGE43238.1 hypothetical protein GCM10011391_22580 [Pullulanibacillus camelliae]
MVLGISARIIAKAISGISDAFTGSDSGVSGLGIGCIIVSILVLFLPALLTKNVYFFGGIILICGILNIVL